MLDIFKSNYKDCRDNVVLEIDEDGYVKSIIDGVFPLLDSGDPYSDGVICRDQDKNYIWVTTDMDFQTLVAEDLSARQLP